MLYSSDGYTTIPTSDGEYSLIINSVMTSSTGTYTCRVSNTAIPEVVMEDIDLTVNPGQPVEVYWYAVIGASGVLSIAILISLILLYMYCFSYSSKSVQLECVGSCLQGKHSGAEDLVVRVCVTHLSHKPIPPTVP